MLIRRENLWKKRVDESPDRHGPWRAVHGNHDGRVVRHRELGTGFADALRGDAPDGLSDDGACVFDARANVVERRIQYGLRDSLDCGWSERVQECELKCARGVFLDVVDDALCEGIDVRTVSVATSVEMA